MSFSEVILVGSNVPVFLVLALLLWRKDRWRPGLLGFYLFVGVSAIAQCISVVLWYKNQNNMPVLHVYLPLSFVLLLMFYQTLLKGYINQWVLPLSACGFVIYSLLNTLFVQNLYAFNSNVLTVESILIVVLALSTYGLMLNDVVKEQLGNRLSSLHWINSGLFVYHASNLLLFYFGKIIMNSFTVELSQHTWMMHSFFFVIMYVCFFIGLWKNPRP